MSGPCWTWLHGKFHLVVRRRGFLSEALCGELGRPGLEERAPLSGRWCVMCGRVAGESGVTVRMA